MPSQNTQCSAAEEEYEEAADGSPIKAGAQAKTDQGKAKAIANTKSKPKAKAKSRLRPRLSRCPCRRRLRLLWLALLGLLLRRLWNLCVCPRMTTMATSRLRDFLFIVRSGVQW